MFNFNVRFSADCGSHWFVSNINKDDNEDMDDVESSPMDVDKWSLLVDKAARI